MPLTVAHSLTMTTPDDPAFECRPSHWNESHVVTLSAVGSEVFGAFSNAGNVSFALETNGRITASANVTAAPSPVNISAGTTSNNLQTVVFSNSNGVSFGLNGSTVTASHNALTTAAQSNHSHGVTLNLTNLSGTTGGNSNGITLSLSAAAQSVQTQNMVSVLGSTGNISFANANGITFGGNGSTITASHNALTTAALSDHSHGNPTLALTNLSGTTASNSAGFTLSLSAANPGGGGDGYNVAQFTNSTANSTMALVWAGNSNGSGNITLGLTGSTITGSAPGGGGANINVSAGTTSNNLTAFVLSNSNNVSFGLNGSTITASASQSVQTQASGNIAGSGFTSAGANIGLSGTLNSNGLSLSATVPAVPTSYVSQVNGSSGALSLAVGSSLSASTNGSTITFGLASNITTALQSAGAYLTTAALSNHSHAFSASGGSSVFQTLSFNNANGLTFSNVGGAVQASYTVPTVTQYISATNTTFNGTNVSGSLTHNTAGLRIDLSVAAPGGGAAVTASASNGSFTAGLLAFSNANNVTFGTSAGSIITASVAAPGAAAEQNAINLLGANTAGNTTATGSTIGLSGLNLTLSGTNGSQIVISAPATSSLVGAQGIALSTNGSTVSIVQATQSGYNPYQDAALVTHQIGQGTLQFEPEELPPVQFDRLLFPLNYTGATNSTATLSASFWFGLYTRNASSLSLLTSTSGSTTLQHSGTVGSHWSLHSGMRLFSIPLTSTLSGGVYWIGALSRTSTSSANVSLSNFAGSVINSNFVGFFGSSHNTTQQYTLGQGVYSATTSGMPASVAFSQIRGSDSGAFRPPIFMFGSGTV